MVGTVMGELPMEKCLEACREYRWVQVRVGMDIHAAVDPVGCRKGENVLLLSGEAGRNLCMGCPGVPVVAAVLSGNGNNG